ncbi:MAG: septum site-determining protein MinC [Synergistaceae bacterium]|nr:septum site-determining protein MinC [Synergistaceae bacterium]
MIKLKGMADSVLRCIISEELPASGFGEALRAVMEKGKQILPGARVVLDFGARALPEPLIASILSGFVWPSGICVVAWITYDAASQEILKRGGLSISEPLPESPVVGRNTASLVLHRSLRSGQRVEHRGDVIIVGHVNSGAEVLASGNITIIGRLKGLAHAGYEGDENSSVVVRSMEAPQVRIGGKIGSLEREANWWARNVIVSVRDERVLIEYWPPLKNEAGEEIARERPIYR